MSRSSRGVRHTMNSLKKPPMRLLVAAAATVIGACGATSNSTPRLVEARTESTESNEVVAASTERHSVATRPVPTTPGQFLHRFGVARVRGDGTNEYNVVTRPAPDDTVVALVSYDGALSIAGERVDGGYRDFAVVKLSASGEVLWVHTLAGDDEGVSRYANALAIDRNGDVFVGGIFGESGAGFSLLRLSPQGTRRWLLEPTGRDNTWSEVHDIAVDANGQVIVAGHYSSRLSIDGLPSQRCSTSCGFVAAFDGESGEAHWVDHLRSPDGAFVSVEATASDDVIVAGHFGTAARIGDVRLRGRGELVLVLARYSSEGSLQWAVRQGTRGRDELIGMVGLTEDRAILQSTSGLFVVSESDGSLLWEGSLQSGQQLVECSERRSRFWLARVEEQASTNSTMRFSIHEADGSVLQVGALRVEAHRFLGQFNPTLSPRALFVGGVITDRRWDANPATPFVVGSPLHSVFDEQRLESLPRRGTSGGSRCAPPNRLPTAPDLFEIRAGLEVVRPAVRRCGVDLRELQFELHIDGDGTVSRANPRPTLSTVQSSCVTEALQQARFCPFFSESYSIETEYQ